MTPLLTRIREKVADARPELRGYEFGTRYCSEHTFRTDSDIVIDCAECKPEIDTIRLADILLAIEQIQPQSVSMKAATTLGTNWGGEEKWSLREDDLEKQSPETLEFIGSLLNV